jgi:polyisoprenoid-binding protein YceI
MIRILSLVFLLLNVSFAQAAAPAWNIVPKDSKLTFTAIQNDAPVSGEFKTFSGDIHFDPAELATSKVNMIVDVGSVTTSYADIATTLKTPDWFDTKLFPQAVFKADKFIKTRDKTYQASGTLTVRDKTQPVTLTFVLEDYSKTNARVTGTTVLKRTLFGVGKGDWAKTNEIKDDVQIKFTLVAVKK